METRPMPIVVRVAGLPCGAMDAFSSPCGELVDALSVLEEQLQDHRTQLVDRLHAGIRGTESKRRHALLAVKRDTYNGRPLNAYRQSEEWSFIVDAVGTLAEAVVALEDRYDASHRAFVALYAEETARQHRELAGLVEDLPFRCGLAVANFRLDCEPSHLREKPPEKFTKKERRLALTLLRYASRAALKLSPFSTFTGVGLAELTEGVPAPALLSGIRNSRSLVRVRRHILDRCTDLLSEYGPWRRTLRVALNDTIERQPDGRLLFRRPARFRPNEAGKLQFHEESLVRVGLREGLLDQLGVIGSVVQISYAELLSWLSAQSDEIRRKQIQSELDRLVDIGLVLLLPPWSADDPHLERKLVFSLRSLTSDPILETLANHLEQLVQFEEQFPDAPTPGAAFEQIVRQIENVLQTAAGIAGIDAAAMAAGDVAREIYHDVWRSPENGVGPLLRTGRAPLEHAMRSVEPLVRISRLFDHRLDFLGSIDELLRWEKGRRYKVPVLAAFAMAQPLWREFMKFQVHTRDANDLWHSTWNPYGLAELDRLASARERAYAHLEGCQTDEHEEHRIEIEPLNALLESMPERFVDSYGGACLFLQPASHDGSLWMLNRMKEGTGRFGSRYTPLMSDAERESYTADLSSRGSVKIAGESVELLDICCVQGDTLNVHAPQTPKVLTLPGVHIDLAPERKRTLADLCIEPGRDGFPQIRDLDGRRYLPVHLGVCYHDYLPTMVKFLCAFGPSEMGAVFPKPRRRNIDSVTVQERTVIGNVVIHRKAWRVAAEELRRHIDRPTDHEAYIALRRWHKRCGIPERVFASERVPHKVLGFRCHPQYVDFTSPAFLAIVRSIAASADKIVEFVEQLPTPEMFPRDPEGHAWAIEFLLDSLCLRTLSMASSAGSDEHNQISRHAHSQRAASAASSRMSVSAARNGRAALRSVAYPENVTAADGASA